MSHFAEAAKAPPEKDAAPPTPSRRQTKPPVVQRRAAARTEPVAAPAAPSRSNLPGWIKAGTERLSGFAMDDVRVHHNSAEPAKIGALAFTKGNDIHLAPGQERHLPHEAWHVVQQKQGRVRATTQMKGAGLNADAGLEAEADRMVARIGSSSLQSGPPERATSASEPVIQLQRFEAEPRRPTTTGWTDGDFVHHYYFGNRAAIDLGNIGLGNTFRNHPSVQRAVSEFVALALAQPASVTDVQINSETDVTDRIFSVGHSTFFRVAKRIGSYWGFHFSIRDWFRDPVSLGFELGGKPYRINFAWTEVRSKSGK
jgi:hypothetical protein